MTMGKEKCMIDVNSADEFFKIINESPMAVQMIRSEGCPHCKETHPIVEKRCNDVKGFVPVIDCPVDNAWCMKQLKGYKKTGVPLLVGTQKGKPVFMVEGARKDEINKNFDIMVDMIGKAKGHEQEPEQHQQQRPTRDEDGTRPVIDRKLESDMINTIVGFGASSRDRSPSPLCVPGIDCSDKDYENSAVAFLLSNKATRKKGLF